MASRGIELVGQGINFVLNSKGPENTLVEKRILDNVNLIARRGQLLAIMGPSGSGKTSLLNLLGGRSRNPLLLQGAESRALAKARLKAKCPIPSGRLFFNGHPVDAQTAKQYSKYVMQSDCLLPFLTVEETVTFAAKLKLSHRSSAEIRQRVEEVITELGLASCRNVIIGGERRKGISGGQKKRVSIAIEIIDDPDLIYLDEPTSGLDASWAFDVVKILRRLAQNGRTIIATIHQPRSQIFGMFDSLLLLSQGRVAYHGPAREAGEFTMSIGLPVPLTFNAADFFLDILTDSSQSNNVTDEKDQKRRPGSFQKVLWNQLSKESFESRSFIEGVNAAVGHGMTSVQLGPLEESPSPGTSNNSGSPSPVKSRSKQDIARALDNGGFAIDVQPYHQQGEGVLSGRAQVTSGKIASIPDDFEKSKWGVALAEALKQAGMEEALKPLDAGSPSCNTASYKFICNLMTLTHRAALNMARNVSAIVITIVIVILMSLLTALLYFRVQQPVDRYDCVSYFNFLGALAFAAINNSFSAMQFVIKFPETRPQFNRESAGGLYNPVAYFIGLMLGETPFLMIAPSVGCMVLYFLINMGETIGDFFFFFFALWAVSWAASGWFYLAATISKSTTMASTIAPIGVIFSVLMSGIWITESSLPAFWSGVKYLTWVRYLTNAFLLQRFSHLGVIEQCAPLPKTPGPLGGLLALIAYGAIGRFFACFGLIYTNRRVGMES